MPATTEPSRRSEAFFEQHEPAGSLARPSASRTRSRRAEDQSSTMSKKVAIAAAFIAVATTLASAAPPASAVSVQSYLTATERPAVYSGQDDPVTYLTWRDGDQYLRVANAWKCRFEVRGRQ